MVEIIAELCQNHNGDLKILEEMVHAAAEAGATYAKIQSLQVAELTHRPRFDEGLVEDGVVKVIKRPYAEEYDRLKKLDLSDEAHHFFLDLCKKAKIKPMTTVFSRSRVPFVASLHLDTVKVASFDCASYPMIEELKQAGVPRVIVSTGTSFDHEIERTAALLKGTDFALLHCISIYPTPLKEAHLNRIHYLKKLAPVVGLSDHSHPDSDGHKMSVAGMLQGAQIIERHFTILPKDKTKDGPVSVNPRQLGELVSFSRMPLEELASFARQHIPEMPLLFGQETRDLSVTELLNRDYYRGRFASRGRDGGWVYNWEKTPLSAES